MAQKISATLFPEMVSMVFLKDFSSAVPLS